MSLNHRRSKFVYEAARLAAIAAEAPIIPELYEDRESSFRKQFEEVTEKQMGPNRNSNAEELHQDWVEAYKAMGWVYGEVRDPVAKTYPDMVPYEELGHLERDKDAVFVAMCEIARKWAHEPGDDCDDKQELEKKLAYAEERIGRCVDLLRRCAGWLSRVIDGVDNKDRVREVLDAAYAELEALSTRTYK